MEIPPYHSKAVGSAVQVQFYVCNGKRKRSQSQRFTYLSGNIFWDLKGKLMYLLICLLLCLQLLHLRRYLKKQGPEHVLRFSLDLVCFPLSMLLSTSWGNDKHLNVSNCNMLILILLVHTSPRGISWILLSLGCCGLDGAPSLTSTPASCSFWKAYSNSKANFFPSYVLYLHRLLWFISFSIQEVLLLYMDVE